MSQMERMARDSDAEFARLTGIIFDLAKALKPLAQLYYLIDDRDADPDTDVFFQHDGAIVTYGDIRCAKALTDPMEGSRNPVDEELSYHERGDE